MVPSLSGWTSDFEQRARTGLAALGQSFAAGTINSQATPQYFAVRAAE
jgi:hypothetical protein